jgi:DNA-binding CsgD family transcriptional regulator/type IV secretory pathway VirB2 component (pilin)
MLDRQYVGRRFTMNAYIIVMDAAATLLLSTVAVGLVIAARRAPRGPFRASSLGGAAVCLLLMMASLHHLLMVAAHSGLLASHWADWLLGPLAAIQATLVVLVAGAAVILGRHYWHRLGRAHTMIEVLTDRLPPDAHAKQARLTAREQEVLDLIRKGVVTDREIGRALQIAPATAATHVQRILRKTELHNRHDLMLLPPRNPRPSFPRATRQNMAAGVTLDSTR